MNASWQGIKGIFLVLCIDEVRNELLKIARIFMILDIAIQHVGNTLGCRKAPG